MKTIFALCALVLVAGGLILWQALRLPTEYGAFVGAPAAEVADLLERPQEFQRRTVAIEGQIRDQCTTMGCYFFFRSGKKMLRIDLQEIAMNAPRRNGRVARVEGQMVPYGDGFQFVASAVKFE